MSAINPASFQTPVGGLQIPGSVGPTGPSAFNSDHDQYLNRHSQRQHPVSTSAAPTQTAINTFDPTWSASRENNAINGMAFQQLYAQPFPSHDLDVRQLDQYSLDYRPGVQQVLNMHAPFTSSGYPSHNLHHSTSFTSRPDSGNGGQQTSQVLGRDWNQSFQGLSLGH